LPKLQTGIHAEDLYLSLNKKNKGKLAVTVKLEDEQQNGAQTRQASAGEKAIEQLKPAPLEDRPKLSQHEKREVSMTGDYMRKCP
jgi:hypothetical protein